MIRTLVLIPTYNEVENISSAVQSVRVALPNADVLVLDDSSPDGTGSLADALAKKDARVSVMHRTQKSGLGAAYLAGFAAGLADGYDVLIEFDADGSHPAHVLPELVAAVTNADAKKNGIGLAIGSRWIAGGSVINWPRRREFLSRGGNAYARAMLGLSVNDSTAGFRAYRAEVLRALPLDAVRTKGYGFQVDMTRRVAEAGFGIVELPIAFREREHGESKMNGAIVIEAMWMVTRWGIERFLRCVQRAFSRR
jgi:dolichol-phosphate mannosyltransferase